MRAETQLLLLPFCQSTSRGCEPRFCFTAGVKLRSRSAVAGYHGTYSKGAGEFRQGSRWAPLPSPRLQDTGLTLPMSPRRAGPPSANRQPGPPACGYAVPSRLGPRSPPAVWGSVTWRPGRPPPLLPTPPRSHSPHSPKLLAAAVRPPHARGDHVLPLPAASRAAGRGLASEQAAILPPTASLLPGRRSPEILRTQQAHPPLLAAPSRRGSHSPGRPAAPAPPPLLLLPLPPPAAAAIFPCRACRRGGGATGRKGRGCPRSALRPGRDGPRPAGPGSAGPSNLSGLGRPRQPPPLARPPSCRPAEAP